ncbi:MAG TPA: DUF2318 domain-containing protein [Blastocatellia bacterium]|nr:DUF2318 domain-containing protein [Blastocatellia bacterium]
MSKKGHSNHTNSRQEKWQKFQQARSNGRSNIGRNISIGVVAAMGIAILYVILNGKSVTQNAEGYQSLSSQGQDVVIPVSELSGNQARFYSYALGDGKNVGLFIVKSSDGVIRAAFDACDVCYKSRRGYHQEGDDLICNNCGRHFPSSKVNETTGGCNPISITRQVQNGNIVIKASDLARGGVYF